MPFQERFLDQMIKATFAASAELCNTILQFNDNKMNPKNPTHHRVLKNVMQSRLNLMNVNVEVSVPV